METTTLRSKGQITIPVEMRKSIGMEEDDLITISTWSDKAIIIFPQKLKTAELLRKSAKMAKDKGISLEDLLMELDEIRHNS